jgi:hypothetical protein
MIDTSAASHGLSACLRVPIAADSVDAIRLFVGTIVTTVGDPNNPQAILVQAHRQTIAKHPKVKLWQHANAAQFEERLHPNRQVWVHVDYTGYRQAYQQFGIPPIPPGYFLDHVQNREAIRLRNYSHPYIRLCPVSRAVNTSGGVDTGGEGMEKQYLRDLQQAPAAVQAAAARGRQNRIIYADPMDLTKMLDIPPGTQVLAGVAVTQALLFPS